jgi:hypothetical protein
VDLSDRSVPTLGALTLTDASVLIVPSSGVARKIEASAAA